MLRLVRRNVSSGSRFKRFWVPSLDRVCELSQARLENPTAGSTTDIQSVTDLIGHVRIGGTNKSTGSARLEQADAAVIAALTGTTRELHVLDIGCSDGTTSIEMVERIEAALRVPVTAYLMDRYIWVRRARNGALVEYTSSDDQLVMVRCGPLALAPAPPSFFLASVTNRLAAAYLGLAALRHGMQETGRFPLLSPRVLARPGLHIREGNVLQVRDDLVGCMDVVRAANLLHADYFSNDQLETAVTTLVRYLREGGLLVLTRNHQEADREIERGTVWRRTGGTLQPEADFGGGSELKGLVTRIFPT